METQNKLTLKQIYLKALAENLTCKEAAFEYNCNATSLSKKGAYHKLPPLKSHWNWTDQRDLNNLSTNSLLKIKDHLEQYLTKVKNAITQKEQPTY